MSRRFDELSRSVATGRSRRQVLALFAKSALGAFVGANAVQLLDVPSVSADEDCNIEYPPKSLIDCPNKRPHPSNVKSVNGCGPAGGSIRFPQGFGQVDFATAGCNQHDICYETCGASKAKCDTDLGNALRGMCEIVYSDNGFLRIVCKFVGSVYELAPTKFGDDAFKAAQLKDCECCRPKIYCSCTNRCYDDAVTCATDCHASLACFTGICIPATTGKCPPLIA